MINKIENNKKVMDIFAYFIILSLEIVIVIYAATSWVDLHKTPYDYNQMSANELKKSIAIEGDLKESYGCYSESHGPKGGDIWYYAIPIGDGKIMGISVLKSKWSTLSQISTGELDSWKFRGIVKKMNSMGKKHMYNFLTAKGYSSSEINEKLVPYYIEVTNQGPTDILLFGVVGIVPLVGTVLYLLRNRK